VVYALSGVALESADTVVRGLPEDLTRSVQQAARIHVESSLDTRCPPSRIEGTRKRRRWSNGALKERKPS
jgi:hypothetical protein